MRRRISSVQRTVSAVTRFSRSCARHRRSSTIRHRADDMTPGLGYCDAVMLHINDLTYRIQGRAIFDHATAGIPEGHKVGLVGRNGAGKTTLLKLIAGELGPDDGGISMPRNTRVGWVAQEAPGGPERLIDF